MSTTQHPPEAVKHSEGQITVEPDCIVKFDTSHHVPYETLQQIELSFEGHEHAIVIFGDGKRLKANAARIALCWNLHDDLAATLGELAAIVKCHANALHHPAYQESVARAESLIAKTGGAT